MWIFALFIFHTNAGFFARQAITLAYTTVATLTCICPTPPRGELNQSRAILKKVYFEHYQGKSNITIEMHYIISPINLELIWVNSPLIAIVMKKLLLYVFRSWK